MLYSPSSVSSRIILFFQKKLRTWTGGLELRDSLFPSRPDGTGDRGGVFRGSENRVCVRRGLVVSPLRCARFVRKDRSGSADVCSARARAVRLFFAPYDASPHALSARRKVQYFLASTCYHRVFCYFLFQFMPVFSVLPFPYYLFSVFLVFLNLMRQRVRRRDRT